MSISIDLIKSKILSEALKIANDPKVMKVLSHPKVMEAVNKTLKIKGKIDATIKIWKE